jgi:hypothetical protein
MVAITVILAAVIGAFVLEIGDQQETAPNTSFDTEQRTVYMKDGNGDTMNGTMVTVTHAGGDRIDVTQFDVSFDGNRSVWGLENPDRAGESKPDQELAPQPDIRPTLGSNEQNEYSSGQPLNVVLRSGNPDDMPDWADHAPLVSDEQVNSNKYFVYWKGIPWFKNPGGFGCCKYGSNQWVLERGDTVQVVWTAESGGKDQTLFKYDVQ